MDLAADFVVDDAGVFAAGFAVPLAAAFGALFARGAGSVVRLSFAFSVNGSLLGSHEIETYAAGLPATPRA
ncbi:MAG: hypothetical protein LC772_01350 [Chloroflexi bacterium]|nr:hypothetical protein [Chloroflexota bacterium]